MRLRAAFDAAARASDAAVSRRLRRRTPPPTPADAAVYAAASHDTTISDGWPQLWHDDGSARGPRQFLLWDGLKAELGKDDQTWGFWIRWYEGCLNGNPMDWDLIFTIATTLTKDDWDKGPEHVAARIARN